MKLEENVGLIDRFFRLLFGVAFVLWGYYFFTGAISYVIVGMGLILLVTVLTGFCTFYAILDINTKGCYFCDIVPPKKITKIKKKKSKKTKA
ncbi:DUF2892 domain-containing protein [Candidatus Micrarchaeota archaeon]|nr:DUF2892 domain-containing protein [Candidatus Micrarchaeota archaeon]